MKKKIAALLILLVVCVSVFAGCNLFVRDDRAYYEAVVASITYENPKTGTSETVNITRRDYIVGYNSYGAQYEQNYGYSHAEAVEQTLQTLINQKLVKRAVEDFYKQQNNPQQPVLTDGEKTYLWDATYNAIYENFKEYYYTASGAKAPANPEEEKTELFSSYLPNGVLLENTVSNLDGSSKTVYSIKKQNVDAQNTVRNTYQARKVDGDVVDYEFLDESKKHVFQELMYDKLITSNLDASKSDSKNAAYWTKAFNDYVADIKENYSYKSFANNKDAFLFEMDRVYNIVKDNYFSQKYTEIYKYQNGDNNISQVSVDDVLKRYTRMVKADYATYANDKAAFDSAIVSNAAGVDYIYQGNNAAHFFNVAYVKIALSDDDKTQIENINKNANLSQTEKDEQIEHVYGSLKVDILDEYGQPAVDKTGKTLPQISAGELLEQIKQALEATSNYEQHISVSDLTEAEKQQIALQEISEEEFVEAENKKIDQRNQLVAYEKAEAFRKFLYQYNDDTSQQNAAANVVFGIDSDGQTVLASSTFADDDASVESEFEKAIKKLYYGQNNAVAGTGAQNSQANGTKNGSAKIGDITDIVRVDDDGLYIFFYAGEVENLFAVDADFDAASHPEYIKKLASTRQNIFLNKSLFDVIFDDLSQNDTFTTFQSQHIMELQKEICFKVENAEGQMEKVVFEKVSVQNFDKVVKSL